MLFLIGMDACLRTLNKSRIAIVRSKKRIKGQNFCQTIEYLSFHRSGYLSNDRYMLFEMFQYQINCSLQFEKTAYWYMFKTHHIDINYLLKKTRGV